MTNLKAWMLTICPRRTLVVLCASTVVLCCPLIHAQASNGDESTSAMVDTLPSIYVRGFELIDFEPAPELGWTEDAVTLWLETRRQENPNMNIQDLRLLVQQLNTRMKKIGLMFGRVTLEEKEVVDGHIPLRFQDGRLGEVVIMDAKRTKPKVLVRPFLPYMQRTAVRQDLDAALYQLDQLPGLDVFGFFSVTSTPGLSRLNLRVVDESTWTAYLHTDNYGSEAIDRSRAYATLEILSPTGWGDKLKFNAGRSYGQPGFFEGYVLYTIPVGERYQPFEVLVSNSDFNLGQGFKTLGVFGQSVLLSFDYRHRLENSPLRFYVGAATTDSKIDSTFFSTIFFRESRVNRVSAGFDFMTFPNSRSSRQYGVTVRVGESTEQSTNETFDTIIDKGTFSAVQLDLKAQYFPSGGQTGRITSFDLSVFGSGSSLPSVEQIGFGGKNGIPGLPTGYFSADEGVVTHLRHDLPVSAQYGAGLFHLGLHGGYGGRHAVNGSQTRPEQSAGFFSASVGYTWRMGNFKATYDFGRVLSASLSDDTAAPETIEAFNNNLTSRHYLSLSYDFGEH